MNYTQTANEELLRREFAGDAAASRELDLRLPSMTLKQRCELDTLCSVIRTKAVGDTTPVFGLLYDAPLWDENMANLEIDAHVGENGDGDKVVVMMPPEMRQWQFVSISPDDARVLSAKLLRAAKQAEKNAPNDIDF